MKIENQVCTATQGETIEKLLGVNIKSFLQWIRVDEEIVIMPTDTPPGFEFKLPDLATTYYGPAFTVAELGQMIGKGAKASEAHWQWLIDCVNSGLSGTVAYNAVALAGFIITQLQIGNFTSLEVNMFINEKTT